MAALDWIDGHAGECVPARGSRTAAFAISINAFLRNQYARDPEWLSNFRKKKRT